MTTAVARFAGWVRRTMPTREAMARSRWVPARALESQLWRFNRRSVPRGVALGLLVGILLPVAQIVLAAILCLPGRANVPVAALTTFVTNPFTTPFIWAASYAVGASLLCVDASVAGGPIDHLLAVTDGWALASQISSIPGGRRKPSVASTTSCSPSLDDRMARREGVRLSNAPLPTLRAAHQAATLFQKATASSHTEVPAPAVCCISWRRR